MPTCQCHNVKDNYLLLWPLWQSSLIKGAKPMIRRSWVRILAESVIGGPWASLFPLRFHTKEVKKNCTLHLISSVCRWASRLYARWGVEMESGMNRPNDLQNLYQCHWIYTILNPAPLPLLFAVLNFVFLKSKYILLPFLILQFCRPQNFRVDILNYKNTMAITFLTMKIFWYFQMASLPLEKCHVFLLPFNFVPSLIQFICVLYLI